MKLLLVNQNSKRNTNKQPFIKLVGGFNPSEKY